MHDEMEVAYEVSAGRENYDCDARWPVVAD